MPLEHLSDCCWADPNCTVGPDTCRCHKFQKAKADETYALNVKTIDTMAATKGYALNVNLVNSPTPVQYKPFIKFTNKNGGTSEEFTADIGYFNSDDAHSNAVCYFRMWATGGPGSSGEELHLHSPDKGVEVNIDVLQFHPVAYGTMNVLKIAHEDDYMFLLVH